MAHPIAPARVHLRPKVPFLHFALVDHYWGDERNPAAAQTLKPALTNPGFWQPDGVDVDAKLQKCLDDFFTNDIPAQLDVLKDLHADPTVSNDDKATNEWKATMLMRLSFLRFAVANLKDPNKPRFAGNFRTDADPGKMANGKVDAKRKEAATGEPRYLETWESASTGKIAILYAAHQLRFDLLVLAAKHPDWKTADDLFDGVLMQWERSQDVKWAELEKLSEMEFDAIAPKVRAASPEVRIHASGTVLVMRHGQEKGKRRDRTLDLTYGTPVLKEIFDASKDAAGHWSIEFKGKPSDTEVPARQAALLTASRLWNKALPDAREDHKPFTFYDLMWLMIDNSHNHAASKCVERLGYFYINSVLWQSGLFDPSRHGGMWIGGNYWYKTWRPPPIADPPRQTPDGDVVWTATSAAAGVAFFTALQQGKLVNPQACTEMKKFLDRLPEGPKTWTQWGDRSPIADQVKRHDGNRDDTPNSVAMDHVYAKIGIGGRDNVWDVALIVRKHFGKHLTYAAAILDSDSEFPLQLLTDLFDDCITKTS